MTTLFAKGYITEQKLDEEMERTRTELFSLPVVVVRDTAKVVEEALSMGETVVGMADYWDKAIPEGQCDIVLSLLKAEGLTYDLEQRVIISLPPRDGVLPVLALGLEATEMWERRNGGLWLREKYWPPVLPVPDDPHRAPTQRPSLTPAQQERAIALVRQGMSLRKVAELFDTSYQSIHRLMKRERGLVERSEN